MKTSEIYRVNKLHTLNNQPRVPLWYLIALFCCLCMPTAYTRLCLELQYSLKIPYLIRDNPNVARLLILETVFWAVRQHCPMSEKNVTNFNGICILQHISSLNFHRVCV